MKLIVDNNVRRLVGLLRALGYDTALVNPVDDDELIAIARREGRIILTKDEGILRRHVITGGEVEALRIEGDDWRRQLAQVVSAYGLETRPRFTRCLECNTLLEARLRDEARPWVPPYVNRTQQAFLACPTCNRHYWRGTHWQRMTRDFDRILS